MLINKKILSVLIVSFTHINSAFAALEFDRPLNLDDSWITISGPADKFDYGSLIRSSDSVGTGICNSQEVNYTLTNIAYEPLGTYTGRTYQPISNVPFPLWDAKVEGFALTPFGGNMDDGPIKRSLPLPTEAMTMWKGWVANAQRIKLSGHKMSSSLTVYKDIGRFTGETVIPRQTMFRYLCKDENGTTREIYNFYTNPYLVKGTVTGCTPDNSAVVLDMDKVAQGSVENADPSTLLNTRKSTFSLQCDPSISVSVSVVDLSDLTNTTDTSTLSPGSTATGIGFAITTSSGQRMRFGPDGSSNNIPGQEKYFVRTSGNASSSRNNPVSFQLGFSYVRKPGEVIKTGTAKSVIGLTYSYQ